MLAGHLGIALALGRAERRVNLGFFVLAAVFLDIAVGVFAVLRVEEMRVPADFDSLHQATFYFPYSHGLLAALLWSALAGLIAYVALEAGVRRRASLLLAAAVFSHWLLDALVQRPQIPLAGEGWIEVGLGLWDRMALALSVEGLILLGGLVLFLKGSGPSRARKIGLVAVALFFYAFTLIMMTMAPQPPSGRALAASFPLMLPVLALAVGWLGRRHPG